MGNRIEEIKSRLDAAPPRPWFKDHRGGGVVRGGEAVRFVRGESVTQVALAIGLNDRVSGTQEANADLIANAPSDLEYLLGQLEEARSLVQAINPMLYDTPNTEWCKRRVRLLKETGEVGHG